MEGSILFESLLMKLGYTITYVPNVAASLQFFEQAFGLKRQFLHEGGDYGELATGHTTLAFASHTLGQSNFPEGYIAASESGRPLGVEIALVTDDVAQAHANALAAGARELKAPQSKPWGQVVSYLRCPDGCLVELCTPVPGADDLQTLRALNKRFIHNFVTNDVASHDAILHPQFRNMTSLGAHMSREAYLRYWATGFDNDVIIYWDMRDERITLHGDTALISATNRWERVQDGATTVGMTSYTDTYVRADGQWLCVLAQLLPVAPQHYPADDTIVVKYLRGQLQ
jgi:lactoylglutathione lyase